MSRIVSVMTVLPAGLLTGCTYLPWWTTPAQLAGDAAVIAAEERKVGEVADDFVVKASILQGFAMKGQNLLIWVSADVYQGEVMLTGAVKEEEDEKKAEELAKSVDGVRRIFNEIQVTEDGSIQDTARDLTIEYKVQASLLGRINARIINYRWRCVNGIVYLIGTAKDSDELDEALDAILGTDGVEDIVHHIHIKEKEKDDSDKPG